MRHAGNGGITVALVCKVWGKVRLDDADEMWTWPTNGTYRFFKVSVEMK